MIEVKEKCWDTAGTWIGEGPRESLPRGPEVHQPDCLTLVYRDDPDHTNRKRCCGGTFICLWCRRAVGFCFGCSHDNDALANELCDDCWDERENHNKERP